MGESLVPTAADKASLLGRLELDLIFSHTFGPPCPYGAWRFVERLANILKRVENPAGAAMLYFATWIASCDGELSAEELAGLRSIAQGSRTEAALNEVITVARSQSLEDLQLACDTLKQIHSAHRRPAMQLAIGMSLADRVLSFAEGHLLRLLADVLQLSPDDLDVLFREMTGDTFPIAPDPSSIAWWEERERRQGDTANANRDRSTTEQPSGMGSSSSDLRRLRDLAMLGLDENASIADIRTAFRRMASIHHPDRFESLGPEAVKAAELTFRRLREAFERLNVA